MSASAPARMAGFGGAASATPKPTELAPKPGSTAVERDGHGLVEDLALTREEQSDEFLLMGLRLREGIDLARYEALSGRTLRRLQIEELAATASSTRTRAAACA